MGQFVQLAKEKIQNILKNVIPNQVFSSEIFFMIINNNLNVNQPRGGTHWSLLIYVKGLNTFFHIHVNN
ncbi:15624_t:CDS:2 [Entrophospora sp. SA101]|nr:15624_t:CDS:2 [Entrophospora sp. SA101]